MKWMTPSESYLTKNSGNQYERLLENYLPDIRLLSRYRVGEAGEPDLEEELEPLEEFDEPEDEPWGDSLNLDQEPPTEIFLAEESETPEDAPHLEAETLHHIPETTAQTAAPTPSSANPTPALKEVRVVERRVLVVQIAKDETRTASPVKSTICTVGWGLIREKTSLLFNFFPMEGGASMSSQMKACKSANICWTS